jgi:hypothetical protein
MKQPVDRLRRYLRDGHRVQRLEINFEQPDRQIALGKNRLMPFLGIVFGIQREQHIRKSRIRAAAIDKNLLAGPGGHMHRLIDRQAGARQNLGPVVLARHRLFPLLLMELEEVGLAVAVEESVQRIEAVFVEVDADIAGAHLEQIAQQRRQHALCLGDIMLRESPDPRRAARCRRHLSSLLASPSAKGEPVLISTCIYICG